MNVLKHLSKLQIPKLGLLPCTAIILIFSLACMLSSLYQQPNSFLTALGIMSNSGSIIFLLNWLPIFLVSLFLYFALGSCSLACGLTGVTVGLLSIANYYKITLRQAPLMYWDLQLGGEVLGVAHSFDTEMIMKIAAFIVALFMMLVLAIFFVRSKKPSAVIRVPGALVTMLFMAILAKHLYGDAQLYDSMYVDGNIYNDVNQFNSRGFVYCFIHKAVSSRLTEPAGYNIQQIEEFYSNAPTPNTEALSAQKNPHIIMIMSEAFSDFALDDAFDFTGYTNPLQGYRQIKGEAVSGYIAAPNIGGGTADTEFDVLTGINSRHYRTVPYAYSLVSKPVSSIVSTLKRVGYGNVAIHPGHDWFYNRSNVYKHLGFDRFLSISDFDEKTQLKAMYINETAAFDAIIREFEDHVAVKDNPLFNFCVTIQNHGPYFEHYGAEKNFNTALNLSEYDLDSLYNYFYGLADCDRELNRLVEYLRLSPEPVVLVYFGDHLPLLSYEAYDEILPPGEPDTVSEEARLLSVPFIIWANDPAKEKIDSNASPAAPVISPASLGALLLDMLGFSELDPYMAYLQKVSESYPILLENRYATPDGLIYLEKSGATPQLELLRQLEYHRLFED